MTYISKNLLLDLPLNKPKEDMWRDESGHDRHATANPLCKKDTLPKLGSCLHLESKGQLKLSSPIIGTENKLTVEFWALPSDATETALRLILGGPVAVWMSAGKMQWSFIGAAPKAVGVPVDEALEALHHWAIAGDRADADSPFTFTVYRDGVEVEEIPTADNGSPASDVSPEELVIGGAAGEGWTGRLVHLRIWGAALTAQDLKKNMTRDITAHAAFKASTGLEWRLLNADDEPSLYIQGGRKQELRLVVENRAGKTLIIPRRTGTELSRENWHFNLVFRPGTLAKRKLDDDLFQRITQANPGWRVVHDKWEQQDRLHFLWTGPSDKTIAETKDKNILAKTIDKTLAPGESLTIVLPDVAAEPGSGSRTTRVLLKYDGLKLGEDSTTSLDGHRSQLLNILYRDPLVPHRRLPLEVGVVGAPAILNNGTETCLTLYIKNLNRDEDGNAIPIVLGPPNAPTDKKAKFILEIDSLTEAVETPGNGTEKTIPVDAKGLGDVDDLLGATPTIAGPNAPIDINGGTAIGSVVRWEMPVKGTVARVVARLADLVGLYQRLPVENEWHKGRIQLDGENLKWTNNAGVSWRLIPDLQSKVLKTDASNPYDENGPRHFTLDQKRDEQDGFLRDGFRFGGEFYQRDVPVDANLGLEKNETVLLTLAGLKTTAPPGRSVLRLRYEDFDEYGEGIFEIPIDRVPAVPAKLTQGGAGYGLAIGHDPRAGQTDPNAEVLNEVLSVRQVGNGDAVRIENVAGGSGLSVVQNGIGRIGAPVVHLKLNRIEDDILPDASGNEYIGTVMGSLQVIDDDKFGQCLNFDGTPGSYVTLHREAIPSGKQATFSFWAWGADSLPQDTILMEANDALGNRTLMIHLPWSNGHVYFDCGNVGNATDRTSKEADAKDFKGRWTHWAFTKDAERGEMKIYLDGKLWHSDRNNRVKQLAPATATLGGREDNKYNYRGKLAHFRSYDRVLSPEKILWLKEESAAVRIENAGDGSGLTVIQNGSGPSAKFSGGGGVEITGKLEVSGDKARINNVVILDNGNVGIGKEPDANTKLDVDGRIKDKTGLVMPVGSIMPYAGSSAPDGWLLCDGKLYPKTSKPDLFAVIRYTYGQNTAGTSFRVPDLRDRFLAGAGNDPLGETGGNIQIKLSKDQMPRHSHGVTDPGHQHKLVVNLRDSSTDKDDSSLPVYATNSPSQRYTDKVKTKIKIVGEGKGNPVDIRPLYVTVNYIIKY